jgi:serine/threonine protein kinase
MPLLKKSEVINDTYTVKFFIGEGAFGEVYRVSHKFMGLQVMKLLKKKYVEGVDTLKITKEAVILSKLTHENVVRVFETNTFKRDDEKFYFITMEFVSGESISDLLKREIHLPLELSMKIQTDYLKGLSFAQENKIIHRDINTDNILLSYKTDQTQALLSDFGLAQTIDQLSKIPDAAGRYLYFAPECYSGIYLLSSDVFSSGIVLYKMLTGFFPWECNINGGESAEEIGRKIALSRKKKFIPASYYDRQVPKSLDKVIEKSLELDIEKRYKNSTDFLNALNKVEINF